jgi:DNA-binding NarL/FixJ family response regulator
MGEAIRILIADDHPVVRYGLTHLLGADPELCVVGEASTAREVVEQVQALKPDVTVLDMEMGEAHGVDVLRALRDVDPLAPVIIYTAYDNSERIVEAVHLGIQGYLLKDVGDKELARAIRVVNAGGTLFQPAVTTKLLHQMRRKSGPDSALPESLTEREQQVLVLLAGGHSNQSVADALYISERTVKFHVSSILAKLAAKNRTEAVMTAIKHGLLKLASDSG